VRSLATVSTACKCWIVGFWQSVTLGRRLGLQSRRCGVIRSLPRALAASGVDRLRRRRVARGGGSGSWEPWLHLTGIADVGARSDGSLVAMAAGTCLWSPARVLSPRSRRPRRLHGCHARRRVVLRRRCAAYRRVGGCSFNADDLFVLDLTSPPGVARVDPPDTPAASPRCAASIPSVV